MWRSQQPPGDACQLSPTHVCLTSTGMPRPKRVVGSDDELVRGSVHSALHRVVHGRTMLPIAWISERSDTSSLSGPAIFGQVVALTDEGFHDSGERRVARLCRGGTRSHMQHNAACDRCCCAAISRLSTGAGVLISSSRARDVKLAYMHRRWRVGFFVGATS